VNRHSQAADQVIFAIAEGRSTAAFEFWPMGLASQGGTHGCWEMETGAAIGGVRAASDLQQSPNRPFYAALHRLRAENDLDLFVEALCVPFYSGFMGRLSIPRRPRSGAATIRPFPLRSLSKAPDLPWETGHPGMAATLE